MQIISWKQKVPCIMRISILETTFVKKSVHYTRVNKVHLFIIIQSLILYVIVSSQTTEKKRLQNC